MNNLELARFLATVAWHLSCMVVWHVRGNLEKATKCENDFREVLEKLDDLEALEVARHDA